MQELMSCKELKGLNTDILGKNYIYYNKIDSTQKEIWKRVEQNNIANGTLIRAEEQTAGVGTHGRKWITYKNNIAFSFYMELYCNVKNIEGLTTQIAEVIIDIIKEKYNISLEIKLPNDIYYNGKKIGGILTETKIIGNLAKFVIIGIGLNNSQTIFDSDLKNIASSIKKEFGIIIDVEDFITCFCNKLEQIIIKRIEEDK